MMTYSDIAQRRLHNQHIAGTPLEKPEDVIRWLVAVQAQDYAGAKWAVAQRTHGVTDAALDQAFADGVILRTHAMRPTWHFVTPADIRWLLALTAPRVHTVNAPIYRRLELDDAVFAASNAALVDALQGGKHLTRQGLAAAFQRVGIAATGLRLAYLLMRAELDAVICSGGRRGRQFTYALLDERAPQARILAHDEALAEFARRYFLSRGPATVHDFSKWSGLTVSEARAGLEMVKPQFVHQVIEGQTYWFEASTSMAQTIPPTVHLLPNYDEYISSYKARSVILDSSHARYFENRTNEALHFFVIDGKIVGIWKRRFEKDAAFIEITPFNILSEDQWHAVASAAKRYSKFVEMPTTLVINGSTIARISTDRD